MSLTASKPVPRWAMAVAGVVLSLMFVIELTTAVQESQTWDEAVHLSAGVSYWRTGDYRLNPEHPPLMKLVAAIPVALTPAELPLNDSSWSEIDEWRFGDIFLYENRLPPDRMLLLGRLPMMALSLLLGWRIFKVSAGWFGAAGGITSLALYALDPSVIAHSRYITTDIGFTLFAFWSLERFERLLESPSRRNTLLFCLTLFAAILSKFSFIAFGASLLVLAIVVKIREPQIEALKIRPAVKTLLLAIPIMLLATWAIYGFDVRSPANDPRVSQLYQERERLINNNELTNKNSLQRFVIERLGDSSQGIGAVADRLSHWQFPLYTFFRGATAVISHATGGHGSFLLGRYSDSGWWYYFPIAFLAKTTIPTLVGLIGVCFLLWLNLRTAFRKSRSIRVTLESVDRRWIIYGVPATVFFLISLFSHLNLGWRHILPIYPMLFVMIGSVGALTFPFFRKMKFAIPVLLSASILLTQVGTYPNQMGYFSPLVGGNINGPNILQDSNLDWGQDLPKLKAYVRRHHISRLPFAYFGRARVGSYLPETVALQTNSEVEIAGQPSGVVAISIGQLYDKGRSYSWLWKYQPVERVGSSILIYSL